MDENSSQELLLPSRDSKARTSVKKFLSTVLKWVLKIAMLAAFVIWLLIIFMYPVASAETMVTKWTDTVGDSFLGFTGSVFLLFSGPVITIALLSAIYLMLNSGEEEIQEIKEIRKPRYRLWTFPVLVEGPFGVISAAELIGILLFTIYLLWVIGVYAVQKLSIIFVNAEFTTLIKWSWFFRMSARGFGLSGAFCLSFLFLPISRGSSLFRVLNIPFEHAIRYHVWLGHLCMCLFTLHGSFYFIGWIMSGEIPSELISWTSVDGANLAGIINIFFGWSIWITSLPSVRPKNFELFYYTHHLYIIFIIFFAMHVGNFFFCIAAGSIFLFMIDRFLRFCQSKKSVEVISTTYFPCGVVELVLSRPASICYTALSSVFLRLPKQSFLQWHPFSLSSSPLDGKKYVSVLIKGNGDWTSGLKDYVRNIYDANGTQERLNLQPTSQLIASVEGPYGHELPYYLTYENLMLVAGGIGISPFIAVLSNIIHRIKQGKPCLPRNIILIWTMKRSNELSLLSTIDMESIRSLPFDRLHLEVHIYITQQSGDVLESGVFQDGVRSSILSVPRSGNAISVLASTGNKIWFGGYMISSIVGLFILMSLLNVFYITPYEITNWWYQGLLLAACMIVSVVIFGGAVLALWHNWGNKNSAKEELENDEEKFDEEQNSRHTLMKNQACPTTLQYGSRPDFKEIFGSIPKLWGHVDVGVIVCGPPTLEASIAAECRSFNISRNSHDPIFHFNSNSFSL